jgi:hypothetical protein
MKLLVYHLLQMFALPTLVQVMVFAILMATVSAVPVMKVTRGIPAK